VRASWAAVSVHPPWQLPGQPQRAQTRSDANYDPPTVPGVGRRHLRGWTGGEREGFAAAAPPLAPPPPPTKRRADRSSPRSPQVIAYTTLDIQRSMRANEAPPSPAQQRALEAAIDAARARSAER
jgi:hypothetical protein